mmetsp:Transcript_19452/g.26903  ORF Transcript_19452/g.26903 Transcript_19452/m.26903 type:complete len:213 (-) Transcript_19452:66-704(-)|eukprot:CAMPEP_0196598632 /NCGR_PEP_ID=MMETSP1081-20130531/94425_1 /TAXON_ID=36882 /ORGANISM="Pyramimonas amylifera, Strain CCMP720" /LENGTH=212 /DNA_ID=CAMNT_0041924349 /DNA_START=381 /DNA_END=1019 /DNA_ORIENTATION=-
MFSLIYGFFEYLFRKVEFRVLILGIDKSGKTTLLEKIKSLYTEHEGLPPGKILPTVGLNIGRAEAFNAKLVFWDLGGQTGLRSIWEKYYAEAHAVVYVVDVSEPDRFEEAKSAFNKAVGNRDLNGAPVLVLANKRDLVRVSSAQSPTRDPSAVSEVHKFFGLASAHKPSRPCRAFDCSSLSGDGVKDGIVWLVDSMRRSQRTKLLNEQILGQ